MGSHFLILCFKSALAIVWSQLQAEHLVCALFIKRIRVVLKANFMDQIRF